MKTNLKIAYFGGEPIGVPVLQELNDCGLTPSLIVCNPDRPGGRGQKLTPPPIKTWAESKGIETWQPLNLKDQEDITKRLKDFDLFVVVAYNKIMPKWLIETPKHKTINVHPSLLPKLRGMSPIRSAILEDKRDEIGVSIMLMDEKMDHGPLLAQKALPVADEHWPIDGLKLDTALANLGGTLLADAITKWTTNDVIPTEQDHEAATYTKRLTKEMGELDIDIQNLPTGETAYQSLLKIRGLAGWPGTFFWHKEKRVKIIAATIENDTLRLKRVIPEGKPEIAFEDFYKASV